MSESWFGDPESTPWRTGETEGVRFTAQALLSGEGGGPEAFRFRFEPTPAVYAHMHLTAQFQLVLAGEMRMPRGRMNLGPLCVHYTDRNVPYGPFGVGDGHDMLVLHPRSGGLVPMDDAQARRNINLAGRLVVASPQEFAWEEEGGGRRRKVLIARGDALRVELLTLPRGAEAATGPPRFGRYDVVVEGEVSVDGRVLRAPGLRYSAGDEPVAPFVAHSPTATVMTLAFDAQGLDGGIDAGGPHERAAAQAAI